MFKAVRRIFLAGVLILTPIVVTVYLLWKVFISVDGILAPLQGKYPIIDFPGAGIALVTLLILITGVVAGNLIGGRVIARGERVISQLPLVRRIYTAVKELSEVFLSDKTTVFQEVVMINYPHKESFALAFVTRETPEEFNHLTGRRMINVFVPTTPNPTSGFLLMLPADDVIRVPVSVEEGLKMVISGGAFAPNLLASKVPGKIPS